MKHIVFALLAALALPCAASAQQGPPPGGGMMQMHQQMRADMLGALTPQSKTMLATVAGQLATSTAPDVKAAAAQLDAVRALGDGLRESLVVSSLREGDYSFRARGAASRDAIGELAACFGCVELSEGSFWAASMTVM